jgi:hypothetical protein
LGRNRRALPQAAGHLNSGAASCGLPPGQGPLTFFFVLSRNITISQPSQYVSRHLKAVRSDAVLKLKEFMYFLKSSSGQITDHGDGLLTYSAGWLLMRGLLGPSSEAISDVLRSRFN